MFHQHFTNFNLSHLHWRNHCWWPDHWQFSEVAPLAGVTWLWWTHFAIVSYGTRITFQWRLVWHKLTFIHLQDTCAFWWIISYLWDCHLPLVLHVSDVDAVEAWSAISFRKSNNFSEWIHCFLQSIIKQHKYMFRTQTKENDCYCYFFWIQEESHMWLMDITLLFLDWVILQVMVRRDLRNISKALAKCEVMEHNSYINDLSEFNSGQIFPLF